MGVLIAVVVIVVLLALLGFALSVRIVKQYEQGVLFRLGRLQGSRSPGLTLIIPVVDVLRRVSLRIVTEPIQSQGIITRDNVSVDVSAVAYYKVVDAVRSVVAIENIGDAIDQIAQTTLRKVVGQHSLDQTLAETDKINLDIRKILDVTTAEWGVEVTIVELKESMCRWPLGDPATAEFRYCGSPTASGPYCAYHGRLAYQPAQERRRDRDRARRTLLR